MLMNQMLFKRGFSTSLGTFSCPGEIASNGYKRVLGDNRGVLWVCARIECYLEKLLRHVRKGSNGKKIEI